MMLTVGTATHCYGFFQDYDGKGVPGLSVTIDILSADGTLLVSAGVCQPTLIVGLYVYDRTFTDAGLFPFIMKTTSPSVQQQELPGIWHVGGWPDQLLSDIYALTHNETGDPVSIVIPPPQGPYQCRVFAPCYDEASRLPIEITTATFKILRPYYYEGKYHDIQVHDGVLSTPDQNGNRYVYRDLVWGAYIEVNLPEVGIVKRGTVPALSSVHVFDLQS